MGQITILLPNSTKICILANFYFIYLFYYVVFSEIMSLFLNSITYVMYNVTVN